MAEEKQSPSNSVMRRKLLALLKKRIKVSEEMYEEWKSHPVTLKMWQLFTEEFGARALSASQGGCKEDTAEKTGVLYEKMLSEMDILQTIINLTFDDILDHEDLKNIAELRLKEAENADEAR